jgi:hypothetical protein
MACQVEFTITIEISEDVDMSTEDTQKEEEKYAEVLSAMEDIAAKQFSIYDAAWDYTE